MRKLTSMSVTILLCVGASLGAQEEIIEFTKENWYLQGQVVEHLGHNSLRGRAVLKDIEFENGVIEVDMAFDGGRCFGMILFRIQGGTSYENFYIRPHKTGKYDALQYQPVYGGLGGWQLYSGDGATVAAEIPHKRWVHVKLEVKGTQARVFLDGAEAPALVIHELKRGPGKGGIGLSGPANELAQLDKTRAVIDATKANELLAAERDLEINEALAEAAIAKAQGDIAQQTALAELYEDNPEYVQLLIVQANANALNETDKIIFTVDGMTPTLVLPGPGIVPTAETIAQ